MADTLTFAVPVEWSKTTAYEQDIIVFVGKRAYTSLKAVPTGIEITDTSYWAETGVPTASEVSALETRMDDAESSIAHLAGRLPTFTSGTAAGIDSSYFSSGSVTWERYGDLVVVSIASLAVNKKLVHGVVIATGLPKPRAAIAMHLTQWSDSTGANTMRVSLGTNGKLSVHYSQNEASGKQYGGQIVYVAAD